MVRPFLLRRTKGEVARELPARIETVVSVALSAGERRLYDDVRLAALAQVGDASGWTSASRSWPRSPGCGWPRATLGSSKRTRSCRPPSWSGCWSWWTRCAPRGGRALVFSQFVKHLALAREALEARGMSMQYLDGQTAPAERHVRVEAFQRGQGDLFLISLKAGGTGLNLTAADHVIHLDPWRSPAVEDQATDRAHRIGQTRPVTVSRLVSEGRPSSRSTRRNAGWPTASSPGRTGAPPSLPSSCWRCCASARLEVCDRAVWGAPEPASALSFVVALGRDLRVCSHLRSGRMWKFPFE
ncbi:hypothetical protein BHS09_03985 [Myxococcus xanthus]|uniref:Helicase C-terminal domain-containing protein n=1 Tax=Myxococcus xanthus TaxID=34 RepID=A0AAE6FVQ2_MYXXA|nr:DEAD/DEAH box helicase [Myxococcus xanthus]QDE66223.1 hypothetical protein BHS09_03985 [Myxococcus xanthus]QDE73496.1 hypothetical protein BHS08_03990 [Myxococcus xanthus]